MQVKNTGWFAKGKSGKDLNKQPNKLNEFDFP